jgi:hypothetical protein
MPIVQNPSIGAGASAMLVATAHLTAAQILAWAATPVSIVPSPGAGKILVVLGMAFVYDFGTEAFNTGQSDHIFVFYDGASGDEVIPVLVDFMNGVATDSFAYSSGLVPPGGQILPGDDDQDIQIQGPIYNEGPILHTTLGAGGTGYVANDTGTIQGGSGDATYTVLTVGALGAVLTYQITNPGTLYTPLNGATTATGGAQPGVGVGFTVNITAVATGDGTLKVVTYYQIIPVP